MLMKLRRMVAVKPHKYGTRHLTAGDEYEVPARHALVLLASKKAHYAVESSPCPPGEPLPPTPPARTQPEPAVVAIVERMEALRVQAEQLGIEVDGRWGVARLQYEITKAMAPPAPDHNP
jgi:hypothetical protein